MKIDNEEEEKKCSDTKFKEIFSITHERVRIYALKLNFVLFVFLSVLLRIRVAIAAFVDIVIIILVIAKQSAQQILNTI